MAITDWKGLTGDQIYRPKTGQIDFGITEAIGDLFGKGRDSLTGGSTAVPGELTTAGITTAYNPAAGVTMANQTVQGMENKAASLNASMNNTSPNANATTQQQTDPNAGATGGATGGGSGSGSGSGSYSAAQTDPYAEMMSYWEGMLGQQNTMMQEWMAREEAAKEAQKQAAQSAYDEVLRQAGQMETAAQTKYDTNRGDINARYDTLNQRIADQIANLATNRDAKALAIEDTYGQGKAQQMAAQQKAETRNRNLARAMNRGDSSFFEDIMTGNVDDTAAVLDALLSNRNTSKEDLESQFLQSQTALDNQAADSQTERANMLSGILDEYNSAIETAKQLAAQGLIDYNSAVAGIQSNAANNLLQAASQKQSNNINAASIMAAMQGALGNLGQVGTTLSGVNSAIPTSIANQIGNLQLLNQVDNTQSNALNNLLSMSGRSKAEQLGV